MGPVAGVEGITVRHLPGPALLTLTASSPSFTVIIIRICCSLPLIFLFSLSFLKSIHQIFLSSICLGEYFLMNSGLYFSIFCVAY